MISKAARVSEALEGLALADSTPSARAGTWADMRRLADPFARQEKARRHKAHKAKKHPARTLSTTFGCLKYFA